MPRAGDIFAAQFGQAMGDLVARAEQQHRSADRDHVAEPQNAKLDVFAVDLGAVGAFQIGEHELLVIFLNLDVVAADAFVVELDGVAFFAADGDWRHEIGEDAPSIRAI